MSALAVTLSTLVNNPGALESLVGPLLMLGVLWWAWLQIPRWFREAIYTLLKRRREGDDGRRH
jgi:hypothetical protein